MSDTPEDRRAAALAAVEANRLADAYRLWLPLAEAGDPEAQGHVGSLMAFSLHRFDTYDQLNGGAGPTIDEATSLADRDAGAAFLTAASEAGVGPASFNLAGLYVAGYGGGSWEDRKARAAELYALAYAQGFTCFGNLMNGSGPGQPYLDTIEGCSAASGEPRPGRLTHVEPVAPPDPSRTEGHDDR
jgi:TPR repeat protein